MNPELAQQAVEAAEEYKRQYGKGALAGLLEKMLEATVVEKSIPDAIAGNKTIHIKKRNLN